MKSWHDVVVLALAIAVPVTAARLSTWTHEELVDIGSDAAQVMGAGGEDIVFAPSGKPRRTEMLLNAFATALAVKLLTLGHAEFEGHQWRAA